MSVAIASNSQGILRGLSADQTKEIMSGRCHVHVRDGEAVFHEGDQAYGLFTVINGSVEIFRAGNPADSLINQIGVGGVFGEMGLFAECRRRTASARAIGDTLLLCIPGDANDIFRKINDPEVAIIVLQNLIGILSERLRAASSIKDESGARPALVSELKDKPLADALAVMRRAVSQLRLPEWLRRHEHLEKGEYLFRKGEPADGFYFVHGGVVDVLDEEQSGKAELLTRMHAPNVVGEIGFFSGRTRSASCLAVESLSYSRFSGTDYESLKKGNPRQATEVLLAAAEIVVQLIVERQDHLFPTYKPR